MKFFRGRNIAKKARRFDAQFVVLLWTKCGGCGNAAFFNVLPRMATHQGLHLFLRRNDSGAGGRGVMRLIALLARFRSFMSVGCVYRRTLEGMSAMNCNVR
jgi:hypothetical protein